MPAKTHQFWLNRIYEQCENYPKRTASEIANALVNVRGEERPPGVPTPPLTRTISDHIALFKKNFSQKQKQQYGFADWPGSCVSGSLPDEAGAALLRLLRCYVEVGETHKPTVAEARWFWRLWIAADDAEVPVKSLADFAHLLTEHENDPSHPIWEFVKWHMAFKLWTEGGRDAYHDTNSKFPEVLEPYDQKVSLFLTDRADTEGEAP